MPIEKFTPRYTFTADQLAQLQQVVPEAFADGKINWATLKEALGEFLEEDGADAEHFGLTWPGKRQARRLAALPSKGALSYCPEEGIHAENSEHVFIEGDNLEVLKLLQKAYAGRVKLIYIDPPYNTGNDHVYKDDYSEPLDDYLRKTRQKGDGGEFLTTNPKSSGRFHSNWLNMIYPRLRLASGLLRDDGIIAVSCDDNEASNIRILMNETFGEENFFSQIIVQSNKRGQTYKDIAKTHEYLIIYGKSEKSCINEIEKDEESLPYKDEKGAFDLWELRNRNPNFGRHNRPNLYFPIFVSDKQKDSNGYSKVSLSKNQDFHIEVIPKNSEGAESCWRWSRAKISSVDCVSDCAVLVAKKKRDGGWNIYEKSRKATTKPKSIWADTSLISEQGTVEIGALLGRGVFLFPKPLSLLKKIIDIGMEEDIVLDFFAGSGTTAHAAMALNATDGGNRKFILIQIPEPLDPVNTNQKAAVDFCDKLQKSRTIAELTKERLRRAAQKIQKENPDYTGDLGFRVFKLGRSQFRAWDDVKSQNLQQLQLAFESTETPLSENWDSDTVFFEILLQEGFPLHSRWEALSKTTQEVWIVTEAEIAHRLFICLEDKLNKQTINALMAQLDENDILVCFDRALTDETKAQLLDRVRLRVL